MTEVNIKALVDRAIAASRHAYAPYSHYPVGAALQSAGGEVFSGCNVENASYPVTVCAERTALVKAISEGQREFSALAVVTRNGGSPCGMCRQALYEFAPNMQVIIADMDGVIHHALPLYELLALGFGPTRLDGQPHAPR